MIRSVMLHDHVSHVSSEQRMLRRLRRCASRLLLLITAAHREITDNPILEAEVTTSFGQREFVNGYWFRGEMLEE